MSFRLGVNIGVQTQVIQSTDSGQLIEICQNYIKFGWQWDGKINCITTVDGIIYAAAVVALTAITKEDSPRLVITAIEN